MSFLSEIKRRKVFQVAALYLVVAWLITQIVTAISAPLLLPDWFSRVVIVLLALAFPVVLVFSFPNLNTLTHAAPAAKKAKIATYRSARRCRTLLTSPRPFRPSRA